MSNRSNVHPRSRGQNVHNSGNRTNSSRRNNYTNRNQQSNDVPVNNGLSRNSYDHSTSTNKAENKFLEAHFKLQENVKKHLNNKDYESSSEEEELECDRILGSVLKSYSQFGDKNLGRTQKFLEDAFQSGAAICLICIATVKRPDAIWSCLECYCFFHVNCIQRWAKDSIMHQKQGLQDLHPNKSAEVSWACPKCRKDYDSSEIPQRYYCFCSKIEDPPFQPWLVPHSCGDTCDKKLVPECGHRCLLLCHPGPCPPCPKTVQSECFCGKTAPRPQRCSNKFWACGKICGRILACGRHSCVDVCHAGDCPPCPERSLQPCLCGNETSVRECAQPHWQCDKVCAKQLDCGNHRCQEVCHKGICNTCPLTLERKCPCGKTSYLLPCMEDTPTCGDTCGKTLDCGQHRCFQRCHYGKCGQCLERIVKACRCGLHSKEVPCAKEYLCETKCKNIRDCGIHSCNKKCCDGSCPPCEKQCGKSLICGNHKCQSVCHRGPCYPCGNTVQVSCNCGSTIITVPCGRGVHLRPPRCNKLCVRPPMCHHPATEPHVCHFDVCPKCRQICGKNRDTCDHFCKKQCHSAIWTDINKNVKPKGPLDKVVPQYEFVSYPCQPCPEPVSVTCLGGHEKYDLPCHRAFATSCERPCGRPLSCGNHVCLFKCHVVLGATTDKVSGENCERCTKGCELDRPVGCTHKCIDACHTPPCPPCMFMLRLRCHCTLNQRFMKCGEYYSASEEKQKEMLTCGNQCPKYLKCGHRCSSVCHAGICPVPDQCRQKVKVACHCKRIKKDYRCYKVESGDALVECDDICKEKSEQEHQRKELAQIKQKELEEQKNKEELERYQKKFHGRKRRRERHSVDECEKSSFLRTYWPWLAASSTITLAAVVMYWL